MSSASQMQAGDGLLAAPTQRKRFDGGRQVFGSSAGMYCRSVGCPRLLSVSRC